MDPVIEVLKKDISLAREFFEQDKFGSLGSVGIGIIDNLAIVGKKDLIIYGILLEEIEREYTTIKKRNKDQLEESKKIGQLFIKELYFTLDQFDLNYIWNSYYKFKDEINHYNKKETELLVYKCDNGDFTHQCTLKLIEHLKTNKNLLSEEYNGLLVGILNELVRIMALYGFSKNDLLFYTLLISFARYYMIFFDVELKLENDQEKIQEKIDPYINEIISISSENTDLNERSNKLIGDMLYQSSFYVMNYYMGIKKSKKEKKEDKMSSLPKKSREKIGKIIEEAIEKEIKTK